jgi:hypothetical protein
MNGFDQSPVLYPATQHARFLYELLNRRETSTYMQISSVYVRS